jgi:hypothetical protein
MSTEGMAIGRARRVAGAVEYRVRLPRSFGGEGKLVAVGIRSGRVKYLRALASRPVVMFTYHAVSVEEPPHGLVTKRAHCAQSRSR